MYKGVTLNWKKNKKRVPASLCISKQELADYSRYLLKSLTGVVLIYEILHY